METRQGEGTEALSQETESNRSATPKSQAPSPDPTSRFAPLHSGERLKRAVRSTGRVRLGHRDSKCLLSEKKSQQY